MRSLRLLLHANQLLLFKLIASCHEKIFWNTCLLVLVCLSISVKCRIVLHITIANFDEISLESLKTKVSHSHYKCRISSKFALHMIQHFDIGLYLVLTAISSSEKRLPITKLIIGFPEKHFELLCWGCLINNSDALSFLYSVPRAFVKV